MNRRRVLALLGAAVVALTLVLSSCSTDADVVNNNISQDADNFQVPRRITFINAMTDTVLLVVEGYCSIDPNDPQKLTVTCTRPGGYIRQYLGKSPTVTWIVDQLDPANVSPNFYKSTIKPTTVIPDIELR